MWHLPEGHERPSVARWKVADLRWQERESDGPSPVWHVCVCHHDTPVHTEDMTSLRPSSPCTRQHSCVLVLSGWIPTRVREHAVANPRWVEDAPDTTTPRLFRKEVHLQFQFCGKFFGRRAIGNDHMGEWVSRVSCGETSGLCVDVFFLLICPQPV